MTKLEFPRRITVEIKGSVRHYHSTGRLANRPHPVTSLADIMDVMKPDATYEHHFPMMAHELTITEAPIEQVGFGQFTLSLELSPAVRRSECDELDKFVAEMLAKHHGWENYDLTYLENEESDQTGTGDIDLDDTE